jgi:hypothetical protein
MRNIIFSAGALLLRLPDIRSSVSSEGSPSMAFVRARSILALSVVLVGGLAAVPRSSAPTAEVDPRLQPARAHGPFRGPFSAERAPFSVQVDRVSIPYDVFAIEALPGQTLTLSAPGATMLRYRDGSAAVRSSGWSWTAPSRPGVVPLVLEGAGATVRLNVLVLHPMTEVHNETLNGYRIGHYIAKPLRGSPAYLPPQGFVELGAGDADVLVSPHLTLGQFPCKQPGEHRYLHLTDGLLLKLEAVLQAANAAGYDAPTFHVMSGFRTPAYNSGIGNETVYSRHLWGDAADVWVDADGDGRMDDWNRDGRVDLADIRILAGLAEQVEANHRDLVGGIGLYHATSEHGPFVHVDARGYAARW